MSNSGSLSSVDVLEIKKFALGRSHIEDLTAISDTWSIVDPFADFRSLDLSSDSPTLSKAITKAWEDLESKLQQVNTWQDEWDSTEAEAARFEVGDMQRLREVAKAASERELSSHDTDLIELTVKTLVSLDTLLRLLRSRRETLDVYQARLQWEERRRDCYTTYSSLSRDIDDFVKQARWSPMIYQKRSDETTSTSIAIDENTLQQVVDIANCSPETNRSTPNAGLMSSSAAKKRAIHVKSHSTALSYRCRSFVTEIVPSAAIHLDEIIELRKVPDAFLDEQDKIEDLAESIRSQDVFLIQLSLQWRKADETFRILRSLHAEGKKLHVTISSAHREATKRNRLIEFDEQTDLLKKRLEVLCGAEAVEHYFNLKDFTISSDRLFSVIESSIPIPNCERWIDQELYTTKLKETLDKEMCTAAKYARSACQAAARYEKAVSSLEEIQGYISATDDLSNRYAILHRDLQEGLSRKRGNKSGDSSETIRIDTCPLLLCDVPNLRENACEMELEYLTDCESRLFDLEARARNQIELLHGSLTACTKSAVPLHTFRNDSERVQQELELQRRSCNTALNEMRDVVALAKETRDILTRLDLLLSKSEEVMKKARSEASRLQDGEYSADSLETSSKDDWRIEWEAEKGEYRSLAELVKQVSVKLKSAGANTIQEALTNRNSRYLQQRRSIEESQDWLALAYKQKLQLSRLKDSFDRLMTDAIDMKQQVGKRPSRESLVIKAPEEQQQAGQGSIKRIVPLAILDAIDTYTSSAHHEIILVGPEPASLYESNSIKDETKRSLDESMRAQVNEWCSLLSSAAQEIKSEIEKGHQEEQDWQLQLQHLIEQQDRFAACLCQWDRLDKENRTTFDTLIHQAEEGVDKSALDSLQDSLRFQEDTLGELMEIKDKQSLSTAALARCQQCQVESETMKMQVEELLKSLGLQKFYDSTSTAKIDMTEVKQQEIDTDHEQDVVIPQDVELQSQLPRAETIMEEPRRRMNGSRKSKVYNGVEGEAGPIVKAPLSLTSQDSKSAKMIEKDDESFSDGVSLHNADQSEATFDNINEQLRHTARELAKYYTGGVIDEQTSASGRKQLQNGLMLPTIEQATAVKKTWTRMKTQVEETIQQCQVRSMMEEAERLRTMMQVRDAKMRRFTHLAAFASQQENIETLLSTLLDQLDGHTETNNAEAVQSRLDGIEAQLKEIEMMAEPVLTDLRVRHQLGQLRHSYQDMAEMARDRNIEEEGVSIRDVTLPSRASTNSSLPSLCGSISEDEEGVNYRAVDRTLSTTTFESTEKLSQSPTTPRMLSSNKSSSLRNLRNRAYSNSSSSSNSGIPIAIPRTTPQMSFDRRSVSESTAMATPSRMSISTSRSDKRLPTTPGLTPRHASTHSITGTSQFKPPQRALYTPIRPSTAQSFNDLQRKLAFIKSPSTDTRLDKTPKANTSPLKTAGMKTGKPNQYRANPKSKLDVAVAKIVNKMPMQVSIAHATVRDTKAKEQWHDESGRYWVGHPDPKLCFCRILRSRTVMVRIGGGWQELSTYIVKHYSHLAPDSTLSVAPSPHVSPQIERNNLDELHWADSTTLLATPVIARNMSDGRVASVKNSPESSLLTPLTNIDWKKDSPRGARKNPMMIMSNPAGRAASPSPKIPQQSRFEVEKAVLWIRQDRKGSQGGRVPTPSDGSFDSVIKSKMKNDGMTSRSRRLSHMNTPPLPNWPSEKPHAISRIVSKAKRDSSMSTSGTNRIASTASTRRQPRSSLTEM